MSKKLIIVSLVVGTVIAGGLLLNHYSGRNAVTTSRSNPKSAQPAATPATTPFNKQLYSLTDPTSLWIIVNKHRPLDPLKYAPADLVVPDVTKRSNITSTERQVRQVMASPLKTMFEAASKDGLSLTLESGYRSYDFQVTLYNGYVSTQGQATADTQSARPGHSEHQTGLAADIGGTSQPSCNVEQCYKDTAEGKWLAANTYKYGFIIRYPADKTSVTGYTYEPWHVRYIGTALAGELHTQNIETLEEFFGLGAAPDYQ